MFSDASSLTLTKKFNVKRELFNLHLKKQTILLQKVIDEWLIAVLNLNLIYLKIL